MPGWKRVAPWVVCAGLVACAAPRIELSDPGEISGKLMVFWDREDHFIYYPFYGDPLTYRLPRSVAEKIGVNTIRPGAIYTDGGSIPRAVRGVVGFSPWGYGPAYIVHDWLFVAHHCIRHGLEDRHDPRDRDEVETVRKVDFPLSADILAGVIQALVKQEKVPSRPLAPDAIYTAVDSAVARRLWNNPDPGSCRPVEQDVIAEIESKLRRDKSRRLAAEPDVDGPVLIYEQSF